MSESKLPVYEDGELCILVFPDMDVVDNCRGESFAEITSWGVEIRRRPVWGELILVLDMQRSAPECRLPYIEVTETEFEAMLRRLREAPVEWDLSLPGYRLKDQEGLVWDTGGYLYTCFLVDGTTWKCIQIDWQTDIPEEEWGSLDLPDLPQRILAYVKTENARLQAKQVADEAEEED